MKIVDLQKYRKILIAGYGIEGKSTEAFLRKFHPQAEIAIADKKSGDDYLKDQHQYDLIIKTPGISKKDIEINYTTATNIFFAECQNKIIGITGTKGKSTTAQLLFQFLKEQNRDVALAGNIGLPMLDVLTKDLLTNDTLVVLELSSYQLDDINYSPHISVILNIEEAHLDYHGNFEEYKNAKLRIVQNASEDDFFVFNPEDTSLSAVQTSAKKVPFDQSDIQSNNIHRDTINAVVTIAHLLGYDEDVVQKTVAHFNNLPHRLENVGDFAEITFIDDSASTAPSATVFALESLRNVDTLICGGMSRNHSFEKLTDAIVRSDLRNLVIFPDVAEKLVEALGQHGSKLNILQTLNMKDAVEFSFKNTQKGKVCLLSPGFASYNMYSGFPERGAVFQQHVKEYRTEYEKASQA